MIYISIQPLTSHNNRSVLVSRSALLANLGWGRGVHFNFNLTIRPFIHRNRRDSLMAPLTLSNAKNVGSIFKCPICNNFMTNWLFQHFFLWIVSLQLRWISIFNMQSDTLNKFIGHLLVQNYHCPCSVTIINCSINCFQSSYRLEIV